MAEKRYKEINGVRYEVVPNPDTGSNVIPVAGSSDLPEIESGDGGKVLTVKEDESGTEWAEVSSGIALYGLYILQGEVSSNIAYGTSGVVHITSIEALAGDPVDTSVLQEGDFFVTVSEDYSQMLPPIKKDLYYYEIEGYEYGSLSITVLNTIDQYIIEQGASFTIHALCSRELPLSEQE